MELFSNKVPKKVIPTQAGGREWKKIRSIIVQAVLIQTMVMTFGFYEYSVAMKPIDSPTIFPWELAVYMGAASLPALIYLNVRLLVKNRMARTDVFRINLFIMVATYLAMPLLVTAMP